MKSEWVSVCRFIEPLAFGWIDAPWIVSPSQARGIGRDDPVGCAALDDVDVGGRGQVVVRRDDHVDLLTAGERRVAVRRGTDGASAPGTMVPLTGPEVRLTVTWRGGRRDRAPARCRCRGGGTWSPTRSSRRPRSWCRSRCRSRWLRGPGMLEGQVTVFLLSVTDTPVSVVVPVLVDQVGVGDGLAGGAVAGRGGRLGQADRRGGRGGVTVTVEGAEVTDRARGRFHWRWRCWSPTRRRRLPGSPCRSRCRSRWQPGARVPEGQLTVFLVVGDADTGERRGTGVGHEVTVGDGLARPP